MRVNIKIFTLLFLWVLVSCDDGVEPGFVLPQEADLSESFYVHIDLKDRSDDTFKVEMYVDGLSADNAVMQFAATVPGTYDILNVGRFVQGFEVRDEDGKRIESEAISTNQWRISRPADAHKITYQVKETFDTEVLEYPVYAMAGTSIEEDHVLLNTPMVIGYPAGLKDRDYFVSLSYPGHWTVGTALPVYEEYVYQATDFDHLADSPILMGTLSSSTLDVGGADINVHVYSTSNGVTSDEVLGDVKQILLDAEAFLKELPTDQYDFLYHFGDVHAGALEHSKSSVYVLRDAAYAEVNYGPLVKGISAHEFFHVVTPLNIHSEIIADFNFESPTPSQHLWLYEGVTEWASDFMQYRNGSMSLASLLAELKIKSRVDQQEFDLDFSLQQIGSEAYTAQGSPQFNNIYYRGALVASLLDIRLLELSNGTHGLREVILELIDKFGPDHAFSEAGFFDTFVSMTYPEIADFFDDYVKDTQSLPITDYYAKVGIAYDPSTFGFSPMTSPTADQAALFAAWSKNL